MPSMKAMMRNLAQPAVARVTVAVLTVLTLNPGARADDTGWELEADPIAYALRGYSVHFARSFTGGAVRAQIGLFGADVPSAWHGHDGLDQRSRGVTVKADYFLQQRSEGFFVGLDINRERTRFRRKDSGESLSRDNVNVGLRTGYRFNFGRHLYVTPWLSVTRASTVDDVVLGGERFAQGRIQYFPTVHVGWRF